MWSRTHYTLKSSLALCLEWSCVAPGLATQLLWPTRREGGAAPYWAPRPTLATVSISRQYHAVLSPQYQRDQESFAASLRFTPQGKRRRRRRRCTSHSWALVPFCATWTRRALTLSTSTSTSTNIAQLDHDHQVHPHSLNCNREAWQWANRNLHFLGTVFHSSDKSLDFLLHHPQRNKTCWRTALDLIVHWIINQGAFYFYHHLCIQRQPVNIQTRFYVWTCPSNCPLQDLNQSHSIYMLSCQIAR